MSEKTIEVPESQAEPDTDTGTSVGSGVAKIIAAIVSVGVSAAIIYLIVLNKPVAETKGDIEKILPTIEVRAIERGPVEMRLPSQGMIEPDRNTTLAAEISGKIIEVSEKFETGGEFEKDEVLIEVDGSDYAAAVAQQKATLAEAQFALAREEAEAERALRDWQELNLDGTPPDLVSRKPQLASARAKVNAAEAAVARAENDLQRTTVRAPYPARIRATHVDLGSWVMPGTPVADIYARDAWEIRLPLSLDEFAFVGKEQPAVALAASAGDTSYNWSGTVVRQEGEIDRMSRSVYLVAEIQPKPGDRILQPGLFVQAEVEGITLEDVARVPLSAFVDLTRVLVVDEENRLKYREVTVIRREQNQALVSDGLHDGERICLTALETVVDGMEVRIQGEVEEETVADEQEEESSPDVTPKN